MNYGEYYQAQESLKALMPSTFDIEDDNIPLVIAQKAMELRMMILGALSELDYEEDE